MKKLLLVGICSVFLSSCNEQLVTRELSFADRCVSYGMSEESVGLLDTNTSALLKEFFSLTDSYDLTQPESTFEYLSKVYQKLDELWITTEYGDSYLRVSECTDNHLKLNVYQGNSTYAITIPFECVVQDVGELQGEVVNKPQERISEVQISKDTTVRKHSKIKSDDTLQWSFMAHESGFLPSTYVTYNTDADELLYKFFYCYYAERDESKDVQTLSTFVSMYNTLSTKYPDWSLDVYADYVVWQVDDYDFTLSGTNPDNVLALKSRYDHVNNYAYPTDKLHLYDMELDTDTGELVAIINDTDKLDVNDLKIPKDIRKYPKVVRDSLLKVLYMSRMYHLEIPIEATGFSISVQRYIDSIDMLNGLYDCSAENIGNSDIQMIVEISYKNKLYSMTIIPEEEYYRKDKIQ